MESAEKKQRIRETAKSLKDCAGHDACEIRNCMYFTDTDDLLELIEFVEEILGDSEHVDVAQIYPWA